MRHENFPLTLDEVLQEFIAAGTAPTAEHVRDWITRYPQFMREIIAFATTWLEVDHAPPGDPIKASDIDHVVNQTMSRLENLLGEEEAATKMTERRDFVAADATVPVGTPRGMQSDVTRPRRTAVPPGMTGGPLPAAKALPVLQHWAALGQYWQVSRPVRPVSWASMQQVIDAARPLLVGESSRVRQLLEQSAQCLYPCADPLLVDLGTHRWLAAAREEAYSDWLGWVVQCLGTPARIFPLFGAETLIPVSQGLPVTVTRELLIPEGRLDLVIQCGSAVLLVVEVKKGSAEGAATAKQAGYRTWLARQPHPHTQAVLLVSAAEEEEYQGFRPQGWGTLCQQLRQLAPQLCQEGRVIEAALILAFVGAVEQNLLGFSSALVQRVAQGHPVLLPAAIGNHLADGLPPAEETINGDPGVDAA